MATIFICVTSQFFHSHFRAGQVCNMSHYRTTGECHRIFYKTSKPYTIGKPEGHLLKYCFPCEPDILVPLVFLGPLCLFQKTIVHILLVNHQYQNTQHRLQPVSNLTLPASLLKGHSCHYASSMIPHTHTHTQPIYGSVEFVRDNPGEPVPEETFTH